MKGVKGELTIFISHRKIRICLPLKGFFLMERLENRRPRGIDSKALRTWGLLFAAAGIIGRGTIQAHMLGIGHLSGQELLTALGATEQAMQLATISLILQALEVCALPIFALLLTEGMQHTSSKKAYFLRVL